MPTWEFTVHGSQTTVKKVKFLILNSLFIILAFTLSGCSLVGTQKFAALQVTSTPEASIFLDGKHLGKTPFYSDQLKSGRYTLKLTSGEATYSANVELIDSTLTVVTRDLSANFLAQSGEILTLAGGSKGLLISSFPYNSEVIVDGQYKGKTPTQLLDIAEGEHKVLVSQDKYQDREFSIKTYKKSQVIAQVTLASKIAKGQTQASKNQSEQDQNFVEIAKTPQNFVKVRKEADIQSTSIGQVKTGEKLQLLEEKDSYYKIIFEGKQGWIPAQFAQKI